MARLARSWDAEILEAGSVAEATALLSPPPDLIIADIRLPDGSARTVFREAARSWPRPTIVAISGKASAAEAFELGQMGVRAYLPKPLSLEDLAEAVDEACSRPPHLDPFIAETVGRLGMRDATENLSRVMMRQALAIAAGSRSHAARLLGLSRQAVQQRMRRHPLTPAVPTPSDRPSALRS